jgi:hypothetical protein
MELKTSLDCLWFDDGCGDLASPTDVWAGQHSAGSIASFCTGTMAEAAMLGEVYDPQSCLRSVVIVCARFAIVN